MIDIGINYLTELDIPQNRYDEIYKYLIQKGYINTIKFPGKYCNYESLKNVISLAKSTNAKIDIHGLPGVVPAINSKMFIEKVNWKELQKIISEIKEIKRFSTHIGLENKDKMDNYKSEELEKIYSTNIKTLKGKLQNIVNNKIDIGLENIPGGFDFDIKTITPDYIGYNWNKSDFGIFDIAHAKLAAKQLGISYEEYLRKIQNKGNVKILHVSGNIDETKKYENKPDKHVLIHKTEINDILSTLQVFNNIDLIISEYAYNTKYTYEKEIIIESIVLYTIIKTKDKELSKKVLKILEKDLRKDVSNLETILEKIKKECGLIWMDA